MSQNNRLTRRTFLKSSSIGLTSLGFNQQLIAQKAVPDEPHFLLVLFVKGGLDTTYFFDARSLDQHAAKLQTNYMKNPQEPTIWTGVNGGKTKVSPLVKPLEKFRQNFSILNGVLMADNFDGHEQNINFLFTGNPFGGDWFGPLINNEGKYSLDGLTFVGNIFADFPSNGGGTISLAPKSLNQMAISARKTQTSTRKDLLIDFAAARSAALGGPNGVTSLNRLTQGAQKMYSGILEFRKIQSKIAKFSAKETGDIQTLINSAMQVFNLGISRTVALSLDSLENLANSTFDVHSGELAKKSPIMYEQVVNAVADIFKTLRETPFPGTQKSFLDVTTVMLGSDFNRTTRQLEVDIDQSGTDHNPLSNTILLGGKGIKGNMIIGATDLDTLNGKTYGKVSGAHKSLDPELIKTMGKPFDIRDLKLTNTYPEAYARNQYLTMENVINTLLKSFGLTKNDQLRPYSGDRSGKPAPTLDKLLS
jgi:uncharacterized protein (DUF1501 family)